MPHRRQGFLHLTPHLLVTLFRIWATLLITAKSLPSGLRHLSPSHGIFQNHSPPDYGIFLPRAHRAKPLHTQNTGMLPFLWVFALLLNPTTNMPSRCCSSSHPTRVFFAINRPPPCHSKALPLRPPQRVPSAHPSAPLTPSPPHQ
jgi:hypothetical protein